MRSAAIAALALVLLPAGADARNELRDDPVLIVHGLDAEAPAQTDCNWLNRVSGSLRAWGWTGGIKRLAYYADTNCDDTINHHGRHSVHLGLKHSGGYHTQQTPIEHVGYHLAWYIYDHYSRSGIAVDVFGHSMGGLIIRYALARVAAHDPDFPPYLLVEDVVTGGSPHQGMVSSLAACYTSYQCRELLPGSPFLAKLAAGGLNPQGRGGTDWTVEGSDADMAVTSASATGLPQVHKVTWKLAQHVDHDGFITDSSPASDADAQWSTGTGGSHSSTNTLHPIRWTDRALMSGSW